MVSASSEAAGEWKRRREDRRAFRAASAPGRAVLQEDVKWSSSTLLAWMLLRPTVRDSNSLGEIDKREKRVLVELARCTLLVQC